MRCVALATPVALPAERSAAWVAVGDRVMCYVDDRARFFPDDDQLAFSDRWVPGRVTIACPPGRCAKQPYLSVDLDRTIFLQPNPHRPTIPLRREIVLRWTSPRVLRQEEYRRLRSDSATRDAWQPAAEAQKDHSPHSLACFSPE
ncbi:MAG: hypothetical protein WC497_02315 [Patescibacteria group bacterium]